NDVYKGMFILKGMVIFANGCRGISRDETVYRNADSFDPSRYLPRTEGGNEEPYPTFYFGFIRTILWNVRVCPGRYLGDSNFWIAVATILSISKIERIKDKNGEEIIPTIGMNTGLTSHPKPYECNIRVRDQRAQSLLQEIEEELMNEK
ncbi:hypothetical protein P691DRAFT_683334, partial [Macrolepiota fuliginosa MF-IS2]